MVLSGKKQIIHICTPSNTAADEIMHRLSQPGGILGVSDKDRDQMLVRIASREYQPLFNSIEKFSMQEKKKHLVKVYLEVRLKDL
jgi:hypothetical protein